MVAVPIQRIHSATELLNRELGVLEFNHRVLAQAADPDVPLLERLRFLCIVSSNLDEFFEVRVAGVKEQIKLNLLSGGPDRKPPRQVLHDICLAAHELVAAQYRLLNETVLPELAAQNIRFLKRNELTEAQRAWMSDYFFREMLPVLTPIGLDPAHPFPRLLNKSLNFLVDLEGPDAFGRESRAAIVQAPRILPRIIKLPPDVAGAPGTSFVFLTSILHEHVHELFAGMMVEGCYQFRVTRNSDLFVDEEDVKDLRLALQGELPQRHFGDAVRLEVAHDCPPEMVEFLLQTFSLGHEDLYQYRGPVNLVRLMTVSNEIDRPDLLYPPFLPGLPPVLRKNMDMFEAIRAGDILLHHPYQSFAPVVSFIKQAASDPQVVAIKQTVYRTGEDSALMEALIAAARNGKEITAVVELKARFDEEANIQWAARLEEVGVHVVYGVVGHKTHAKMAMVVRREEGRLRRYIHLGTGNYHPRTARLYTDFGLFTCNEQMCSDVNEVFTQLTSLGRAGTLHYLLQSPFTLHTRTIEAINNEARIAGEGRDARIIAKMNALLEPEIIEALYAASKAGVKIDLIVRGVCALRPGIPGLSANIRVRSIVGRFLEHHRIFYFRNDGADNVYLSSADWMERNFFRRIEVCFPVLDKKLKARVIREGLKLCLADSAQSWEMDGEGKYRRKRSTSARNAQSELIELLAAEQSESKR
ncbi:MAG TPA: polyphosphate kinase 1 [Burkholderiales bacterium]|nr:polyphosphate kinase 1 [Burkholderiales bacterium]